MEAVIDSVLANGVTTGVVFLVMGYAIYKLYGRNQELNDALVANAKEQVTANLTNAAAMDKMTVAINALAQEQRMNARVAGGGGWPVV